jgi:DNA mismatch repair protein MutL
MHLNRIKQFSGTHFVEQALELASVMDDLRLWGWVAPPNPLQKTGPLHYFFINGRAIKDKVVTHALQKAFMSVFPNAIHNTMAYVLYFELDPEQIDINVHPAKQEVRFREPRRVHAFLTQTIESALRQEFSSLPALHEATSEEPAIPEYKPLPKFEQNDDDCLSPPLFGLSAFQRKPNPTQHAKSLGAGIQKPIISNQLKISLGEPLCVIRQQWLLSDNGETLYLIDIRLATEAITGECANTSFFSLQEGVALIRQLEAHIKKGKLNPDSIAIKCPWPVNHLQHSHPCKEDA